MQEKLKLLTIRMIEYGEESSCRVVKSKKEMRVMLKLRGGTAAFQMETSTGGRERRKRIRYARSVKVVKWRMSLIGVLLPSLEQPSTATAAICPA